MACGSQGRQIQVLLALHDGERSFGMSLAQRSPALGPKYTVVSSVFANSPADRAGVCKGYVVRCINDKPMGGLTVAQVANHFRNVGQAKITLEIVESAVSPRTSAFTVAATFGGVATLPNASTTQGERVGAEQRPTAPVTGFSAVSSGRAIAAPGSALAVPTVAAPKQPVLRLGAKPAAKALGLQPQSGVGTSVSAGTVSSSAVTSASVPSADAKTVSGANHPEVKRKAVAPVLHLGPNPKPVQPKITAEKVIATTTSVVPNPASTSVPTKPSSAHAAANHPASSRIPQSPVQTIEAPKIAVRAQVSQVSVKAVTPVPAPLRPAPRSAAPISSSSVAAKETVTVPGSFPLGAKSAAVTLPTGNTPLQPPSCSPTFAQSSGAKKLHSTPALIESNPTTAQVKNAIPASAVHPPDRAAISAKRRTSPSPVVIPPMPNASSTTNATSTPVRSPARSIVRSAPSPAVPVTAQTSTVPKTGKTGKKRGRPRKNPAASNGAASNKGKGKAKKAPKHQPENAEVDAIMDDDDVFDYYAFTSDSDLEDSPSTKTATRKARRRGVTDRTRHSLTVDRLVGMGFTQEDAEASVKEIGDDPDACMVWIISKIEERNFNEDLNRASIQSEQSKRDEEKRMKKREEETLAHAKKFMTLFPTSYMVCPESSALRLKKFLQSTIDRVNGETYLREILSKLLTLEGDSIRWYKEATRSYMLELAGRLDTVLETHDVMTCCARVSANDVSSSNGSCTFVRKVLEEVNALTKALFEMSTNQGGVPPVFLACDKTTQFDLEDDGFEVVE